MSKMLAAQGWAAPSLRPPPQAPRARTSALRAGLPQPKLGRRQQAWGFPRKAIPRPDEGSFSPGGAGEISPQVVQGSGGAITEEVAPSTRRKEVIK